MKTITIKNDRDKRVVINTAHITAVHEVNLGERHNTFIEYLGPTLDNDYSGIKTGESFESVIRKIESATSCAIYL